MSRSAFAAPASVEEKLIAVRKETELKRQAAHDTQEQNSLLATRANQLRERLDMLNKVAAGEEAAIETLKRQLKALRGLESAPETQPALPEVEQTITVTESAMRHAREENQTAKAALLRLLTYKSVLEGNVERQLRKNDSLYEDLRSIRRQILAECKQSREVARELRAIDNVIEASKRSTAELVTHATSLDRYSERLNRKLRQYEAELKQLQHSRLQSKQLVLDEATLSMERDKWLAELRSENDALLTELTRLEEADDFIEGDVIEGAEMPRPQHIDPRPVEKPRSLADAEHALFGQLGEALSTLPRRP